MLSYPFKFFLQDSQNECLLETMETPLGYRQAKAPTKEPNVKPIKKTRIPIIIEPLYNICPH